MYNNRTGIPGVMLLKIEKENKHIEDKKQMCMSLVQKRNNRPKLVNTK
jgi:hypothetical protein